jgi:hypothetical protein
MAMHGYGSCHGVLLSGTPAPAWALTSRYGRHCSLARWPSYLDSPNDPTGYRLGLVYGYGLMGRRCSHCRTLARTYVHGRLCMLMRRWRSLSIVMQRCSNRTRCHDLCTELPNALVNCTDVRRYCLIFPCLLTKKEEIKRSWMLP